MENFIRLLEEAGEKFSNRAIVLELCAKDVTDYERGKIQGQIEMLSHLLRELAESNTKDISDETSSI